MDNVQLNSWIDKLMQFGLTRQAATIYLCLLRNQEMSGYEVSKMTGISRSNVYSALAGLVENGAAYLLEGATSKYIAVSLDEFCQNKIRYMTTLKQDLIENMPRMDVNNEGYITISSHRHIMDKIYNMLVNIEYRAYISMPIMYLEVFRPQLQELIDKGKKIVLLIDKPLDIPIDGSIVYVREKADNQLRLIVDSTQVLTGEMTGAETDSALYCAQKNFVNVFKDSLRNEIRLIELT